ncbi:MAG: LptF/LptG family permease [Candidatus Velthaea sp.]
MTILDRYLVSELIGPTAFGLSAFTLIFAATQILAIGKLVSDEHAPLLAALEYFFWDFPQFVLLVIPMALLLGTLLSMQRLSGESEITAMKAGGVGLARIATPLLIVGLIVSVIAFGLQEVFVPLANDRAAYIREAVIKQLNPIAGSLQVVTPLPGGASQITLAKALDAKTQSLLGVTVITEDRDGNPQTLVVAKRARYSPPTWTFEDATTRTFGAGGSEQITTDPTLQVDVGQRPSQIAKHAATHDPEQLSMLEIKEALGSGQLSPQQIKQYSATYAAKLARPFASFVFVLIAVSFGLRPVRGGGAGLGFGIAVAIAFIYYVVSTVFLTIGGLATSLAWIAAWTPNAVFTMIGLFLLRRASAV